MTQAVRNLDALRANPYPGRGICIGLDAQGTRVYQVYWIMGRSANSRNRVFLSEGGKLRTSPADASKVEDPSLVIYNAMRELPGIHVVTNGDQTDTIYSGLSAGMTFSEALLSRDYEPDRPNFTPRISGVTDLTSPSPVTELSILKKSPCSDKTDRFTYRYEALPKGAGLTITTYMDDGDPLPSFEGEPYLLPLDGSPKETADNIWLTLNEDNRVSLAVKAIEISSGESEITVINAYEAV